MLEAQGEGEADVIQIVVRLIPVFILRIVAVLSLRRRACRVAQLFRAEVIDIIVSIRDIVRELPARGERERVLEATIVGAVVHEVRGIVVAPFALETWKQFALLEVELIIARTIHIGLHDGDETRISAVEVITTFEAQDEAVDALRIAKRCEERAVLIIRRAPLLATREEATSVEVQTIGDLPSDIRPEVEVTQ